MPTIVRFASSVVTMYAADHLPPHFHVRTKDGREALIVIETLTVLSGQLSRRELSAALEWAAANKAALVTRWQELNP